MDARETVREYYDALRDDAPLGPYFTAPTDGDEPVKFGLSETLVGGEEIRDGLAAQTATTTDWTVESRTLRVTERDATAWLSDDVFLAWSDIDRGIRFEFDTRWSGTLVRTDGGQGAEDLGDDEPGWQFVGMHVSTADDL